MTGRIFLSHSHEDIEWCREFVAELGRTQADIWYDEHSLRFGGLLSEIGREIQMRPIFIVILSKSSVTSKWVEREVDAALALQDDDPGRILMPVMCEACKIPIFLRAYRRISGPGDAAIGPTEAARRVAQALDLTFPVASVAPLPAAAASTREQAPKDQRESLPALLAATQSTLIDVVRLPAISTHEEHVREYIARRLQREKRLRITTDEAGNLIALVGGVGDRAAMPPVLLCAHMDRVPPGLAHDPIIRDGVMYSDGHTNLGADGATGIAIMLMVTEELERRHLQHRPLVLLFTVAEEIGFIGARQFDPLPWGVEEGFVFGNAGTPGTVVIRGATYAAFDVILHGKGGHSGKDLGGAISAIEMFLRARVPLGMLDQGSTRISIGMVTAGVARNAIPSELHAQGELRTLLGNEAVDVWRTRIENAFTNAAESIGGRADVEFNTHGNAYEVPLDEPLLVQFRRSWEALGNPFQTMATFIGDDSNALRQKLRVFTVSTGVEAEHTASERVALAPLTDLIDATISVAAE